MRAGLSAVGALALGLAAGCDKEGQEAQQPVIDPAACMDTWAEWGYPTSDGQLRVTPASEADLPPVLVASRGDVHRLAGFALSFVASDGPFAETAADLSTMIGGDQLLALSFEGVDPLEADYATVQIAGLEAPSGGSSLPGQIDATVDLSRGNMEWSFEEAYGTGAQGFGMVFLTGLCTQAISAVDGTITTQVEIAPEGDGYRVDYAN